MMDFVLKMMDFVLEMMDFVLKVMDFVRTKNDDAGAEQRSMRTECSVWNRVRDFAFKTICLLLKG